MSVVEEAGSTGLGGSTNIVSSAGTATSSGSLGVRSDNAGSSGVSGLVLVSTGSATSGDS